MYLAFRLYGDFVWPPVLDAPDTGPQYRRKGTVEIYFKESPTAGSYDAVLRWRPGEEKPEPTSTGPSPQQSIYQLNDPTAWFQTHGEQDLSLWISAPAGAPKRRCVAFRGAFLFDQYKPAEAGKRELRWPLARACQYVSGGRTVLSELIIGEDAGDGFRFNLQLPTLLPQTKLEKGQPRIAVFPFCVLYRSTIRQLIEATRVTMVIGGAIGAIENKKSSFEFGGINKLIDPRLGHFAFTPNGAGETQQRLLRYRYNRYERGLWIDVDRFWPDPSNPNTLNSCLDLIRAMGLSISPKDVKHLSLDINQSVGMSLSFSTDGTFASVTRLTLQAEKNSSGGSLRWKDGEFYFDLHNEVGGTLQTAASRLHLDAIVRWRIADQDIWHQNDWAAVLSLRLHWQESLSAENPFGAAPVTFEENRPVFRCGTLTAAAYSMRHASEDLLRVEAGQPQSLFPDLRLRSGQTARFGVYAPTFALRLGSNNAIEHGELVTVRRETPLRLSLLDALGLVNQENPGKLTLALRQPPTFFAVTDITRATFELRFDDEWIKSEWQSVPKGAPYFASFKIDLTVSTGVKGWQARLGSLEFDGGSISTSSSTIKDSSYLRCAGPGDGNQAFNRVDARQSNRFFPALDLEVVVPFVSAQPIGVDVSRTERARVAPLLIPTWRLREGAAAAQQISPFHLLWRETISSCADWRLRASVYEDTRQTGDRAYVVLSQEPFSIMRFSSRVLGARGDAGTAVVAEYSSEERLWQLKQVADFYRYSFPPQVVGESADKPRRLELHDITQILEADYPGEQVRPAIERPSCVNPAALNEVADGVRRRAVEFRLTPPADVWIQPSDVARGYFTAEWDSHAIFRQRGELGLGAAMAALRAEFLYGLPVGVEVARERGLARRARVAEIEALTGRLVQPTSIDGRWGVLSQVIARRPERLEVWADDPESTMDFAPARFSEGVSFALRTTALHRPPLLELEQNHPLDQGPQESSLRYHPQGLSGGALWPVESANLFDALVAQPASDGGEIEGIALSPLGGDAAQKALFLGGKVAIISQTRNGFIERQQVEVIGRIGALWHRAKHVVVYERSVSPSAQFAPLLEDDPKQTRSRRPVLRKVSEFIELLEPERSYPDFAQGTARTAGFLDRVRFNSRIIPVDSAWSRDLGDYGWEVPLWNREAARQRPQVYSMPGVAFCLVSEGEEKRPVVPQECLDPDFLYFFADFKTPGSNTDLWPHRCSVDYVNVPAARRIAKIVDAPSSGDPGMTDGHRDKRRRSVGRFLPGVRRFTWRLAPASRKVAINAGRAGKPLYVGLDSVTFMRAGADEQGAHNFAPFEAVLAASSKVAGPSATLDALNYWRGDGQGAIFPAAGVFSQKVHDLRELLKDGVTADAIRPVRQAVLDAWKNLEPQIAPRLAPGLTEAKGALQSFKNLPNMLGEGHARCEKLRAEAVGIIQRKAMLIEAMVRDWEKAPDRILSDVWPPDKTTAIRRLAVEIINALRPAFDEAATGVAQVAESVQQARAILRDVEAQSDAAMARTLARMQQAAEAFDQHKPWSAGRLQELYDSVFAEATGLSDDVVAVLEEGSQRLATEMSDAAQQVAGHLAKALRVLGGEHARLLGALDSFSSFVRWFSSRARRAIDTLRTTQTQGVLDQTLAKLATVRPVIQASNVSQEVKDRWFSIVDNVERAVGSMKQTVDELAAGIETAEQMTGDLDEHLIGTINSLVAALTQLLHTSTAEVTRLTHFAADAAQHGEHVLETAIQALPALLKGPMDDITEWLNTPLQVVGKPIDTILKTVRVGVEEQTRQLRKKIAEVAASIDNIAADINDALSGIQQALAPSALLESMVRARVVEPVLKELLRTLDEDLSAVDPRPEIRACLTTASASIAEAARKLGASATQAADGLSALCATLFEGAEDVHGYLTGLANDAEKYLKEQITAAGDCVTALLNESLEQLDRGGLTRLLSTVGAVDQAVRGLQNDLSRSMDTARAYGDRVLDSAGKLASGGLMAAPSNLLKLYSAVSSAPELAALKSDIDRLRSSYDDLSDIIETTPAKALFDRMGDELKALGLSLPFDRIGEGLLPADLSSFDIGNVFRNFGGAKLSSLLKGYKLPQGVRDAVKVTHDFDAGQARAWVQIDVDARMPGRRSLFSVQVFKADLVDMHLVAQVRFEVSKDTDTIARTGHGAILAALDMVVGGQSMVRFEKLGLHFSRESGLDVQFDPKNIRLNPALRFVQDFLAVLFPDEVGGMRVIKENGVPVGLEHEFVLPPTSINFGTSGISNIAISNHFELRAFPDFILSNRFSLSGPERPFIFSFFIIGGTGYVQVECLYRPFDSELVVAVEAAAGGSAALAFAAGPFSGQVFITLSVALQYRKAIGRPGGGLSIGAVLTIAGYVDVAGIATVGIVVVLRMTYRDNGRVDGQGTLSVTIRISRFFKFTARANAKYQLRSGGSQKQTNSQAQAWSSPRLARAQRFAAARSVARLHQARV